MKRQTIVCQDILKVTIFAELLCRNGGIGAAGCC
jgi:hypothetical protein